MTTSPSATIRRTPTSVTILDSCVRRTSDQSTDLYEDAREKVRSFINASAREEVIFTTGATGAINLVARSWGGKVGYIFADANICRCAYVGDEASYNRFQELAVQRQIAEKDRLAAERDKTLEMDSGGWQFDKSW